MRLRVAVFFTLLLSVALPAFAETGHRPYSITDGRITLLAVIICIRSRRDPIGGWLLYYYIQLYIGFLSLAVIAAVTAVSYVSGAWDPEPQQYAWHLIAAVALVLLSAIELALAERVRLTRGRGLGLLQAALWLKVGTALLTAAIGAAFLPDLTAAGLGTAARAGFWAAYFSMSGRVEQVFVSKDWPPRVDPAPSVAAELSGERPE